MALDFTHKHYVPIMKTKAGERWALSHLTTTRTHITPLLELHPHKSNSVAVHVADLCEDLSSAWGNEPMFLDSVWLHGTAGSPSVVADVFAAARSNNLQAIPVVRTSYDAPTLAQIRAVMDADDLGCMLRISPLELVSPAVNMIDRTLAALELEPKNVHLLLDYQRSTMALSSDIPRVPHLSDWRTLTTASGAFPRSLSGVAQGQWHLYPRTDWTTWEPLVAGNKLARRPTFGDYTMRDPGAPASFGSPIVNVRYTTSTNWLVRVGGAHAAGHSVDMKAICADLIARPEYSGRQYSAGDEQFYLTAQPRTTPGGPTQWVQWSASHHLVFVADQIQQHPAL